MLSDENVQRYAKGLFPVALMLILMPIVDISLRSLTAEAGSLQWRFATVGLMFGNLGTVVLGVALLGFAAVLTGARGLLRGVGFAAIALAVVIVALMALFALDALQVRRLVAVPLKRGVLLSSAGAAFAASLGTLALIIVGRASLLASRSARQADARRVKSAPAPLVAQAASTHPRTSEPV